MLFPALGWGSEGLGLLPSCPPEAPRPGTGVGGTKDEVCALERTTGWAVAVPSAADPPCRALWGVGCALTAPHPPPVCTETKAASHLEPRTFIIAAVLHGCDGKPVRGWGLGAGDVPERPVLWSGDTKAPWTAGLTPLSRWRPGRGWTALADSIRQKDAGLTVVRRPQQAVRWPPLQGARGGVSHRAQQGGCTPGPPRLQSGPVATSGWSLPGPASPRPCTQPPGTGVCGCRWGVGLPRT